MTSGAEYVQNGVYSYARCILGCPRPASTATFTHAPLIQDNATGEARIDKENCARIHCIEQAWN